MRTIKNFATGILFSLVFFSASSAISATTGNSLSVVAEGNTRNEKKKTEVSAAVSNEKTFELSYLRFDVNTFATEATVGELPENTFDYMRFDVNNFINETSEMELPNANEFDYLRFDVNDFYQSNTVDMSELPASDFNYLRFDVTKYDMQAGNETDELPLTE